MSIPTVSLVAADDTKSRRVMSAYPFTSPNRRNHKRPFPHSHLRPHPSLPSALLLLSILSPLRPHSLRHRRRANHHLLGVLDLAITRRASVRLRRRSLRLCRSLARRELRVKSRSLRLDHRPRLLGISSSRRREMWWMRRKIRGYL